MAGACGHGRGIMATMTTMAATDMTVTNMTTTDMATTDSRVSASNLTGFVARAFAAAGLPNADAQILADLMVEADLRGSDRMA